MAKKVYENIIIQNCWHCRFSFWVNSKKPLCLKTKMVIENKNTIPSWCPLPDEDGVNKNES